MLSYTIEDVEAFGIYLQINTVLSVIVNGVAVYLILKHSTSVMGNYKYYILSTVIFAFLMDFHLTFIFGLFPLYPHFGACPAGISKHWGPFWGSEVQLGIFHFTLTFFGLSVFFGLVYQYFSIINNNRFFQTFKGAVFAFIFMLIYPLPSVILFISSSDFEEFLEHLKDHDAELVEVFMAAACGGHVFTRSTVIHLIVCLLQIIALIFAVLIMALKIVKALTAEKQRISKHTLKMRHQYFKVLIIQLFLPMIFMVIPLIFLIIMILLNIHDTELDFQYATQFMTLHSIANAITVIFVIKPYRQAFYYWINKFNCFKT